MIIQVRRSLILAAGVLGAAAGVVGLALFEQPSAVLVWSRWEGVPGIGVAGAIAFTIAGAALLGYPKARLIAAVLLAAGLLANFSLLLTGIDWRFGGAVAGLDAGALQLVSDFCNILAMYLSLVVLPQIFPDGLRAPLGWRLAFALPLGVFVLAFLTGIVSDQLALPEELSGWVWAGVVTPLYVGVLVGAASLVARCWRATSTMRWQVGVFAVASIASVVMIFAQANPWIDLGRLDDAIMQGIYPPIAVLAIGAATLEYHLYDVRLVVRRAVVYGLLTAAMAVSFFVVYGVFLAVLSQQLIDDQYRWVAVAAGLTVLAVSWPLRVRLTAWLERRLLGERHDPLAALSRLPSRTVGDEQRIYHDIVHASAVAVRSPQVALAVQRGHQLEVLADCGGAPDAGLVLPLVHAGERLGELRVGPRSPGEAYRRADRTLLDQLGRQTSALLYGLRRDAELATARRTALAALADERERLGRDLHDSLAPLLAGAGLTAEALRRGMPPGSTDERQAAQLAERLRTAATEIRRVAHDLQPGTVEGGLAAALSNHLNGLTGPNVPRFDVRLDVGELPPETSQTAYLVVLEAINNVIRHAKANQTRIDITHSDDLRIEVTDDGIGLAEPYVSGLGITSMRIRVEALDGSFSIEPGRNGGTRLVARIPIHR